MEVSVPSRGLCFQSELQDITLREFAPMFPSPLGDCVFNPNIENRNNTRLWGFRPLSGIVFSIIMNPVSSDLFNICFRPLSGIVFSITKSE